LTHDWPATTAFDREQLEDELLSYGNPVVSEINRLIEPTIHAAGHIHRGLHATIDGRDFYGLGRLGSDYGQDAVLVDDEFNVQWVNHEEGIML
jgi:hypothetical protein